VVASSVLFWSARRAKDAAAIESHQTIQFGATAVSPEWQFVEDAERFAWRARRA